MGKNMHNAFIYFMFNAAPPVPFAVLPIVLTSVYTLAEYSSGFLGLTLPAAQRMLDPAFSRVLNTGKRDPATGNTPIFLWVAWLEMVVLSVLILQLFTPARSFMLA